MHMYRVAKVRNPPAEWVEFRDASLKNAKPHVADQYLYHVELLHRVIEKVLGRRKDLRLLTRAEAIKVAAALGAIETGTGATLGEVARRYLTHHKRKDLVECFRIKRRGGKISPDEILTPDLVNRLIDAAENARDAALVAVLWECGQRIGATLSLDIRDISPVTHKGHTYLRAFFRHVKVDGQEHFSPILVKSTDLLKAWLDAYPFPRTEDSPVFVSCHHGSVGDRLQYAAPILEKLTKGARFEDIAPKVRFNPHIFRHSRATFLLRSRQYTEAEIKKMMGWSQGSRMLARYSHLVTTDIDNAVLRANGLEELEPVTDVALPAPKPGVPPVPLDSKAVRLIVEATQIGRVHEEQVALADRLEQALGRIQDVREVEALFKEGIEKFRAVSGKPKRSIPTTKDVESKLVQGVVRAPEFRDLLRGMIAEAVDARDALTKARSRNRVGLSID